eukprot:Nitzschia sp. Nitz4//scaffold323_size20210//6830//7876//NITZ4_008692-RA/size20210-processed-gene-0.4-mRNA-1//1//CDS//3329547867//4458//frame0
MSRAYSELMKRPSRNRTWTEKFDDTFDADGIFDLKRSKMYLKKHFKALSTGLRLSPEDAMKKMKKEQKEKKNKKNGKTKGKGRKGHEEEVAEDDGDDDVDEEEQDEDSEETNSDDGTNPDSTDTIVYHSKDGASRVSFHTIAARSKVRGVSVQQWAPVVKLCVSRPANSTTELEDVVQHAVSLFRREIFDYASWLYPSFKHQPRMDVEYAVENCDPTKVNRGPSPPDFNIITIPEARDILEIKEYPASHETIKAAYYNMSMRFHPDSFPDDVEMREEATEMFKRAETAYRVLTTLPEGDGREFTGPIEFAPLAESRSFLRDREIEAAMIEIDTRKSKEGFPREDFFLQ